MTLLSFHYHEISAQQQRDGVKAPLAEGYETYMADGQRHCGCRTDSVWEHKTMGIIHFMRVCLNEGCLLGTIPQRLESVQHDGCQQTHTIRLRTLLGSCYIFRTLQSLCGGAAQAVDPISVRSYRSGGNLHHLFQRARL